ncbi:hypothetical protein B0H17DRAFT_1215706 [Mycena rosella]|uniref:Uncharacterized protein n=1 Tax=Mycena rosella TaxID=1033263 RepID=A0AAD7CIY3_MYCRO|nr:hypothetical protein B0H17DRAFT_1215706 [Mycena rosella]
MRGVALKLDQFLTIQDTHVLPVDVNKRGPPRRRRAVHGAVSMGREHAGSAQRVLVTEHLNGTSVGVARLALRDRDKVAARIIELCLRNCSSSA